MFDAGPPRAATPVDLSRSGAMTTQQWVSSATIRTPRSRRDDHAPGHALQRQPAGVGFTGRSWDRSTACSDSVQVLAQRLHTLVIAWLVMLDEAEHC